MIYMYACISYRLNGMESSIADKTCRAGVRAVECSEHSVRYPPHCSSHTETGDRKSVV